jgi:hypothetical protein
VAKILAHVDGRPRPLDGNVFIERLWRSFKHEDIYLKGYANGREPRYRGDSQVAFSVLKLCSGRRPNNGAEIYSVGMDANRSRPGKRDGPGRFQMRHVKIAALALVVLVGFGTIGSKAADLSVSYRTHRTFVMHRVHYAEVPDGFYYPPYGFWQHAPWGWNWHNWGARPWRWGW